MLYIVSKYYMKGHLEILMYSVFELFRYIALSYGGRRIQQIQGISGAIQNREMLQGRKGEMQAQARTA